MTDATLHALAPLAPSRSDCRLDRRAIAQGLVSLALTVAAPGVLRGAQATVGTGPAWAALGAGGSVVLVRHALTVPGIGDPPGFSFDDCATQRNLSEEGRAQAARLGAAFRTAGVQVGDVLSSRWCRCRDTATIAFGRVEHWTAIDSFFDGAARGLAPDSGRLQNGELRRRISSYRQPDNLMLVTHQVNITALTGLYPAMGEFVVLRPAETGFSIAGRARVA